jgi:hypothetical protein
MRCCQIQPTRCLIEQRHLGVARSAWMAALPLACRPPAIVSAACAVVLWLPDQQDSAGRERVVEECRWLSRLIAEETVIAGRFERFHRAPWCR